MIVLCLGAGSRAPWQPWDNGGHHDTPVSIFYQLSPSFQLNPYKGLGGNEKLQPHRIPTVGIVRKVLSTQTLLTHKHHHHGGAVCPSYGVVTLNTPNPTRLISTEGVGRGHMRWVWYKTIK